MIRLNVQVSKDYAYKLHERSSVSDGELTEILNVEREFGTIIKPLHPGTKDPHLISHFMVELTNKATADRMSARLLQSKYIEAAYIKPSAKPAHNK